MQCLQLPRPNAYQPLVEGPRLQSLRALMTQTHEVCAFKRVRLHMPLCCVPWAIGLRQVRAHTAPHVGREHAEEA